MNVNQLFSILITAKWKFKKPKKADILIYDENGSQFLKDLFSNYKIEILKTRREEINFYIILQILKSLSFKNIFVEYKKIYFKIINPKLIVTNVDINRSFYQIKKIFNCKTMMFQASNRNQTQLSYNEEDLSKNYNVDYVFTFGKKVSEKLSNFIRGSFFEIGSIRNNNFVEKQKIEKNSIVFISQYKSSRAFPKNEKIILRLLSKFCSINKIKLYISTKLNPDDITGYQAYKKILKNTEWIYCPRYNNESSYERVMSADFVVFADSTLGYERLSRGKKTLSLPFGCENPKWCKKNCAHQIIPFAYPAETKNEGIFWLNYYSRVKILSKLQSLFSMNDDEWKQVFESSNIKNMIIYDRSNKKFMEIFKKIKNEIF